MPWRAWGFSRSNWMDGLGGKSQLCPVLEREIPSPKLTASLPIKMDGWKLEDEIYKFPALGRLGLFSMDMSLSGRVSWMMSF